MEEKKEVNELEQLSNSTKDCLSSQLDEKSLDLEKDIKALLVKIKEERENPQPIVLTISGMKVETKRLYGIDKNFSEYRKMFDSLFKMFHTYTNITYPNARAKSFMLIYHDYIQDELKEVSELMNKSIKADNKQEVYRCLNDVYVKIIKELKSIANFLNSTNKLSLENLPFVEADTLKGVIKQNKSNSCYIKAKYYVAILDFNMHVNKINTSIETVVPFYTKELAEQYRAELQQMNLLSVLIETEK